MEPEFQAYVGPQSFEEKDKAIFFGRDLEIRDLLSLVIAHNLVLVYAQSGAGKTSLINAGLIPLLKENQFEVFPVARVKGAPLKDMGTVEISNIFVFNALTSMVEAGYDIERLPKTKLVDFLNAQERKKDEEGIPLPRAIIFDQFEEIFSLYQDHWKDREGFFEQVSDALEADPLLRVVFVMREDFIAQLDPYADLLSERLRTRFHMERLRRDAALLAVKGPLRDTGRSFAEGVAEKLVDDLLTIRVETIPGNTAEVTGEFIEAVQLQVVCQNLWEELPSDKKLITFHHLKTYGNVEQELSLFYDQAIKAAVEKAHIDEEILRILVGRVLITTMGTRGMVYRAQESTAGIPNEAIDVLESMHLIRAEWRAGARWYELTHDRFIKPILFSNKVFNEDLAEKKRVEREREAEKKRTEKEKEKIKKLTIKGLAVFSVVIFVVLAVPYQLYQADLQQNQIVIDNNVNKVVNDPVGITISPDGKNVYVTNSDGHSVSIIDTATNNVTDTLAVVFHPQGIAITQDGKKAYLANLKDNSISVIDTVANTVTGNINLNSPYGLQLSPDGTKLYVTNNFNSSVSVIDITNNTVTDTVPVGYGPEECAVTPDGKIYVTNYYDHTVSVINTTTHKVTATIPGLQMPQGIAVTPDGKKVYVTNGNYGETGTVTVIDTATNNVTDTIPVGRYAQGIAVTPDGTRVYVANEWDWTVSVINIVTDDVIARVPVGIKPFKVSITPDGKTVYVANRYDKTVSVIDAATNEVTATVPVGNHTAITWSNPADIIHGTILSDAELNAIAINPDDGNNMSGNFTYTPPAGTILDVGTHKLHVHFTPNDAEKYTSASKNVAINVIKSTPIISWSKPANITPGTALNSIHLDVVATDPNNGNEVRGNYDYDPAKGTILGAGPHILKVYFTPDDITNYTKASKDVTINVPPSNVLPKTYAYIANVNDNNISVVDLATNTVIDTVKDYRGNGPCDVAFTPDGKRAYVPNRKSNTVSVIDIKTNTVRDIVEKVGNGPSGVAITPDGKKAYVPNINSNNVSVIDTGRNIVIDTVREGIGNSPNNVAINPNGTKVYVTNHGSTNVSVINTTSNTVTANVQVGTHPWEVTLSPDGSKAYVTNDLDKTVSVIDTETDCVVENVTINNDYPGGIAVNSAGTRAYVTSGNSDVISIIDTAANTVIGTVSVGDKPWGIAVSPDGSKACVTNYKNKSIYIIDTATNNVSSVEVGNSPCGIAIIDESTYNTLS